MVQIPLLSLKLQVWSLFRGKSPLTCTFTWHDNNIQLCLKFSRKREENTSTYSNWGRISQDEPQHKAPEKSEFQTLSTNLGCSFCTKRPAKFTFRQWKIECFSWYELMLSLKLKPLKHFKPKAFTVHESHLQLFENIPFLQCLKISTVGGFMVLLCIIFDLEHISNTIK